MARSGAMWPSSRFRSDTQFRGLSWGAQGLFRFAWTHTDLDSAGYIAYQPRPWSNEAPDLTVETVEGYVDEMASSGLAAVDRDTGELLLLPFIRLDAVGKPFVMVSAMRSVQTRASSELQRLGWEQVQAIYPPPMRRSTKMTDEAFDRMVRSVDAAYAALKTEIERGSGTVSETVSHTLSETLSEPASVSDSDRGRVRGRAAEPREKSESRCETCQDTGWVLDDDGTPLEPAQRCHHGLRAVAR